MKVSLVMRTAGVAAVAALGLAACGSSSSGTPSTGSSSGASTGGGSTTLTPQGSTFQANLEAQWATKYTQAKVTYTGTGSSAGILAFTQSVSSTPFAGSDVTMTSEQEAAATKTCGSTALTVPITSGGIAVLFNLPGVKSLQLSASTIAGVFAGKITKWNDSAIAADNPGVKLPTIPIQVFHRSDGSGTTSVLTSFMTAFAPKVWTLGANSTFTNWPVGTGAMGSSGVATGVKGTTGGIGYAETSYAQEDSLSYATVKGAGSTFVSPTPAEVGKSITSGFKVTGTGDDLSGELEFAKMTGYPLSTVSYVLVCSKYSNASTGAAVKGFLTYAAGSGQSEATALNYAPLPSGLDKKVQASIASIS